MLKFIPDHLKFKWIFKHVVKKLHFIIRYVFDQYKTQQMCDRAADCFPHVLESFPECYKTQ